MQFEKKAVIFDLDGVICFTDKFHCQAWKALADRPGICFDGAINNRLRGVTSFWSAPTNSTHRKRKRHSPQKRTIHTGNC